MKINRHIHTIANLLRDVSENSMTSSSNQDRDQDYSGYESGSNTILQGISARSQELLDVAEEVAAEQQARLGLVSRNNALCHLVLSYLRQQPLRTAAKPIVREGMWLLATLPDPAVANAGAQQANNNGAFPNNGQAAAMPRDWAREGIGFEGGADWAFTEDMLEQLANADIDLVLYLVSNEDGWQDEDAQWFARLRSLGAPLLPVLIAVAKPGQASSSADTKPTGELNDQLDRLRTHLGIRPCQLAVAELDNNSEELSRRPPDDVIELCNRILALRPRLGIPLAQDIPWCRHAIAQRIIRTGALLSALVGAEPIPLLDLPIHVALHWKVALQLAAIHGRPGLDFRSREMAGAIVINLVMRYCAQQLLKIIPFVGWLLSGLLSGVSTMLLGHALLRYYENDEIWSWVATKHAWRRQANQTSGRMQRNIQGLGRRMRRTGGAAATTRRNNDDADEANVQTIPIEGQ